MNIKLFLKAFSKYLEEQIRINAALMNKTECDQVALLKSHGRMKDTVDKLLNEDDEKPTP